MLDTPLERDIRKSLAVRTKKIAIPIPEGSKLLPNTAPDLFSNDYLSLASNDDLRASFMHSASQHSRLFGSTGARLLTGNSSELINLERRLAKFFGSPAGILFNSGYDANVGFFSSVPGRRDIIIIDELIHASAQDGIAASRLPKGSIYQFRHNSPASFKSCLTYVLDRHPEILARKVTLFVAVEALYSMDGDFCPLNEILDLAENRVPKESLHVVIDEAHATGLYGPQGRGLVAALGAEHRVHSLIHTFGKARAFSGAIVCCSPLVRFHIASFGRPFIYTTAMPCSNVIALNCSFDYMESAAAEQLRNKLFYNSKYFYEKLSKSIQGFPKDIISLPPRSFAMTSTNLISPIIPVYTSRCLSIQQYLRERGYPAQAIPYPMVPRGKERLRVIMHAGNSEKDLDQFISYLIEWAEAEVQATLPVAEEPVIQSRL